MSAHTAEQFVKAMRTMKRPGGPQPDLLQVHLDAPGRMLTMARLADAAGYKSCDGANLGYGNFAIRIGGAMRICDPNINPAGDLIRPKEVSNRDWVLILKPPVAAALKRVGRSS
jgi:hypothetical protein